MRNQTAFPDRVPGQQRSPVSIAFIGLLLLSLMVGACQVRPIPSSEPNIGTPIGEPTQGKPSQTPDTSLPVQDSGEPLPPQILERSPRGGQDLPLSGELTLTFDQPMDTEATAKAFKMLTSDGKLVSGEVSWSSARTLHFQPSQTLQTGQVYLASLGTTAASQAGIALQEPINLEFNTVGGLQVNQVFPQPGSVEIAADAVITVIFNRPVVPLVITSQQADLPSPLLISPEVEGDGEWVNTSVYTFRPSQPLRGATTYTVDVASDLADVTGESLLEAPFSWQFTTIQPQVDYLELSSGLLNPENPYWNVRLDEYFALGFYQPMDRSSTEAALSLFGANGEAVNLKTVWNEISTRVVFTPTQRLSLGTTYRLTLSSEAQSSYGGSLEQGTDWTFTTVPYPGVKSVYPYDGQVQSGFDASMRIEFLSPMKISSLKENILITPALKAGSNWWYDEWNNSYSTYALQPSTSYEVRLLPGMEDIYGNKILEETIVRFTTAPYDPSAQLQMPYGTSTLRANAPETHELYVSYRNVQNIQLRLYRLTPEMYAAMHTGTTSQWEYRPPETDLIWQVQEQSSAALNRLILKPYTPTQSGGAPLSPGFYFLAMDAGGVQHYGPYVDTRVFAVVSANLTMKSNADQSLFWLTDLESGEPLGAIPLRVYTHTFYEIASGRTDAEGMLLVEGLPEPAAPYDDRFAMTDAGTEIFAFASSDWDSDVPLYEYGIWGSYFGPTSFVRAYTYTDRPIYRPGQPVYFKGIVRIDDDLDYRLADLDVVQVTIENYQEVVYEAALDLNEMGSFSGEFLIDQEAPLGNYTLRVSNPENTEFIGGIDFNVAEYRKPEFQVQISLAPEDVLSGENFTANLQADYYSGGGVSSAQVNWTLSSRPFTFSPPDDYSSYSFQDFEPDGEYDYGYYYGEFEGQVVATGQGETGLDGSFSISLPADLSEAKSSRSFTFEATVTDLAASEVTGRGTIVAHKAAIYLGAKAKSYVGRVGKEQIFDLVALDWDGSPVPGQEITVQVVERRWNSVQEQDATGRIQWTWTVEDVPVTPLATITVGPDGKASLPFTPPRGGIYRVIVTGYDYAGNQARTAAYMWVAGNEFVPWRQNNNHSFELIAGKTSYAPGENAEILLASPFSGEAYALVTVERGRIRYRDVVLLQNNSTIYSLPITTDMAPNIYVSVLIVKGVDEANPTPDYRMGVLELQVARDQKEIQVEVVPEKTQVAPGEQVRYTVTTRDSDGRPVSAEVSLSLSDLATLSLADPNSPPVLDFFYSQRSLGVWTAVPLSMLLDEYNAEIKVDMDEGRGSGSGGGKGDSVLGVVDIREEFPDTAYWEAHLVTGSSGEATVVVTLPDNLTTWRMDARAVTADTRVGQTTVDIVSTRPLYVRPQTPRFFVTRDRARLGAAVHNNTSESLSVTVRLESQGITLEEPADQVVDIPANGQAYVIWTGIVDPEALRVDLVFRAEGGGYRDASRPTIGSLDGQGLPVYSYAVRETVGASGQLTGEGTVIEGIRLPESYAAGSGELVVKVSPSLAAGMTEALTYLENYPYDCVEQTVSRFLPNVLTTQALSAAGLVDPVLQTALDNQVNMALQRLYNWQNPDGGWGWWAVRGEGATKSDVLTTAYVVLGLVEAQSAGYSVDDGVLARALPVLVRAARPFSAKVAPNELNRQAFVLYVLTKAGSPAVSSAVQLYEQRQSMDIYARAYLAFVLHQATGLDSRVQALLSDFNTSAVVSATGTHWDEEKPDVWNWNSSTRTTAIVLSVVSQIDPQNRLNANAVRWLMSNRKEGHWEGTQETAWSIMALTNWMVASRELEANYRYAVGLNGERVEAGIADRTTIRETVELRLDIDGLLRDELNRLAFARDNGPGNLYYTTHLNISLPVEDVQPVDEGIIVSRSYYPLTTPFDPASLSTPVDQAQLGDLLLVRLTVIAPHDLHYLIVDDPLPAGLEAVDQSLNTSQQTGLPQEWDMMDVGVEGWGWWFFEQRQFMDERIVLSASYLPAGTYVYTYVVRAGTVGEFQVIPTTAQEFYFPEVYGRGAGMIFTVNP